MKNIIILAAILMFFGIANAQQSNYELLQGKWQSTDDSTNYLIFEDNHRKEIAEGMDDWDDEEFILSDKCMIEGYENRVIEKDRYISVLESGLCWYISELDTKTLSLDYIGSGNTLTYKRVTPLKGTP